MPRLIDADALNEFLKGSFQTENIRSDDNDEYFFQKGWNAAIRFIMTSIEKKLTIEAEPVRHGRVIIHNGFEDEYYEYCSECKSRDVRVGDNYRPNCGAKLGKEA